MWIIITLSILGILLFAFFVFTNERRKRKEKGIAKKPKKEKVKKEKKVKEPKQQKRERLDTDEVPNYESLQVLGNEDSYSQQGNSLEKNSARDFAGNENDGYFRKEMDSLFEKDNRNRSQRNTQRGSPFQPTYSDMQSDGYASAKPRDSSSGESRRRSIRNIDIHKGLSQAINPYSIGEEFGYSISDFDGRSESEIAAMFRELPPEIRLMIVSNILAQKYN